MGRLSASSYTGVTNFYKQSVFLAGTVHCYVHALTTRRRELHVQAGGHDRHTGCVDLVENKKVGNGRREELRHYSRLARWAGVVCGFWRTTLASNNDSNPSRPLDCIGTCVGRKIVRYSVQTSTRFALEHTHWPQSIIMPSTTLTRPRAGGNIAHWVWLGGHESQVRCYASQYFFKAA